MSQPSQEVFRSHNFGPGPSALPLKMLQEVQQEFLNFQGSGMSILEITNLDKDLGKHPKEAKNPAQTVILETEKMLREILEIPDNYRVLFMYGGGVGQFSAVPMNLCENQTVKSDYIEMGFWSRRALMEAKKYSDVNVPIVLENEAKKSSEWNFRKDAKYVHFCLNETIQGLEFHQDPDWDENNDPYLVCDATSTILSRPIDIKKYGIIYASGGKNIPHGVSVVIIKESILKNEKANKFCPQILDYRMSGGGIVNGSCIFESRPNTPPIFPVYLLGKMLKYLKNQYSNLKAIQSAMHKRADKLYEIIDNSNGFYNCKIAKGSRSVMNAVFYIKKKELEEKFYQEAEEKNMLFLFSMDYVDPENKTGGLQVSGIRATMYIGVADESVDALCKFMQEFQKKYE
ncbi:Pyridoxal phosphate-dependent transferase [Pseudocohnilembus persalinus]|uniref:phosphoserine transaminase n=1 Tax=Pseudocohnilembus persalinus TaxID=266149 RepID=A0A0V0R0R1_PSEPJ|nr:Pyridoxal phosphate-dependent transferase [Pseudocohnilembus persalinus]|eukprot:KRX08121.1 Pyridoxal phosphate-dependent transferase [Pseudocohnilembus persalinus]